MMKSQKLVLFTTCCFAFVTVGIFVFRGYGRLPENDRKFEATADNDISPAVGHKCSKPPAAESHVVCKELPFKRTTCQRAEEADEQCPGCLVPNIVHFVWFGNKTFMFYHYLSVLSAATNQNPKKILFHMDMVPRGPLWSKLVAQVPCLEISYLQPPTSAFGRKIANVKHQADFARAVILLQHGGIYLDTDVIVLKSLNPLRKHSVTMGRSKRTNICCGAYMAEANAPFLRILLEEYKRYGKVSGIYLCCIWPNRIAKTRPELRIHVEETSMQRPITYCDGALSIVGDSYDISNNYMLHLHPSKAFQPRPEVFDYGVDELRREDTTYGAAARAALFGTQDLVFLEGEEAIARDRRKPKQILAFRE